ncbi:MAG: phosphoribosylformylglycinamidine cyclo-ligase [Oscillospiraceae bacterium]|jgi:phosphoribosylformylglycinamidine cyclo-ligase|nr:phosphoribosylformylglycinamidine cyclo-ligase [Oscillospiraceae bacterium]
MSESHSKAYAAAGVDVTAGYKQVDMIKPAVKSTFRDGVLGSLGGFGGLFAPDLSGFKKPIFVSGTDGVGTKLAVAIALGKHDTVGIDCVAMCVNDIICAGAEPLFFLDYIACGRNVPVVTASIVQGVADGCIQAGCALIGGETAEHPGMMREEEYDLAGFTVGIVDEPKLLAQKNVKPGDAVVALASGGLHSNGFSLVRKVIREANISVLAQIPEFGKTLGEELLTPTRIYVRSVLALLNALGGAVHGIAHITGGGLYENAPRMLPNGVRAVIDARKFEQKPVFGYVQKLGAIDTRDMYNTFNMGAGMLIAVAPDKADEAVRILRGAGESAAIAGETVKAKKGVDITW